MPHKVTIQSSGHTVTVKDGETVLAAALREGIVIAYGCRNGVCGTCKGRLVEGTVDTALTRSTPCPRRRKTPAWRYFARRSRIPTS